MLARRTALALLFTAAGCGGSTSTHTFAPVATAPAPPPPRVHRRPPRPAGTLPQTRAFPSSTTPAFHAEMAALWRGVVSGDVRAAMPAFFPETAYAQVKAIASPRADWTNRLVHGYALDIAAAHALARPGAQLVRVDVPSRYAHWVPPGSCYNGVGYYEVPNARVVYRRPGELRSFGIASMISWRGVWYVVHLGAVGRSGVVDDPEAGPGASAPSSTC
jgi:hypothetical protein